MSTIFVTNMNLKICPTIRTYINIYKKIFFRINLFQKIPNSRELFIPIYFIHYIIYIYYIFIPIFIFKPIVRK